MQHPPSATGAETRGPRSIPSPLKPTARSARPPAAPPPTRKSPGSWPRTSGRAPEYLSGMMRVGRMHDAETAGDVVE